MFVSISAAYRLISLCGWNEKNKQINEEIKTDQIKHEAHVEMRTRISFSFPFSECMHFIFGISIRKLNVQLQGEKKICYEFIHFDALIDNFSKAVQKMSKMQTK